MSTAPLLLLAAATPFLSSADFAFLDSSTFRNADCSENQRLTTNRHPLDKCVPSSKGNAWYRYLCSADGTTFQQMTYQNADCSSGASTYFGTVGECVQNMGYTFSSFACVANSTAARSYPRGFVRRPLARNAVTEVVSMTDEDRESAPDVVDWTSKGAHTPVKDQGVCGSCWAFSATEGIESAVFMSTGSAPELSAQQIISCDKKDAAGCAGGDLPSALDYVISAKGIASEQDYPETSADRGENGTCQAAPVSAAVTGYKYAVPPCTGGDCSSQDEDGLAAALAKFGPISICVNSGESHWEFYEGGMWPPASHPDCKSDWDLIDHCVQLVGYDKTASPPYWKVRNSWGTDWGEAGFIRLPMGQNACGLADEAIIVSVASTAVVL